MVQLRGENRGLRQQVMQASREHDGKAAALQKQVADLQASLKSQVSMRCSISKVSARVMSDKHKSLRPWNGCAVPGTVQAAPAAVALTQ